MAALKQQCYLKQQPRPLPFLVLLVTSLKEFGIQLVKYRHIIASYVDAFAEIHLLTSSSQDQELPPRWEA